MSSRSVAMVWEKMIKLEADRRKGTLPLKSGVRAD